MPRYEANSHEQPAHYINSVALLKSHLCDLAYNGRAPKGSRLRPEECANCISPCCYVQKLLKLLRAEGKTYEGDAQYQTGEMHELTRSGATILSMKRVLRRRAHGRR